MHLLQFIGMQRFKFVIGSFTAVAIAIAFSMFMPLASANAACSLPNQITNGQIADATTVMGNFNAVTNCVNSVIAPSGTPVPGKISVFSSPNSITSSDLSGDCATSGGTALTCTKTNGVPLGYFSTGTDAGQLTGTIQVARFNNGFNADTSHFLRGDGVWAVPSAGGGGGSVAPTVVQVKLVVGNQPATDGVAFDTPVTPGNIIVALATHWANNPIVGAGWVQILTTNGSVSSGLYGSMKVATENDVSGLLKPFTGGTGGQSLALFEIENASPAPTAAIGTIQELTTATPVIKGAAAEANSLLIGIGASEGSTAAPTAISGATSLGETQGTTTNASPRELNAFKMDGILKGAADVSLSYAASAKRFGIVVAIAPQ